MNEYKKTEISIIPKEWEVKKFGDICKVNQGLQISISKRLKRKKVNSKLYITLQSLANTKEYEYIENPPKSVCCNRNDVLLTRTGNTGMVVSNVEGVFHNNFFKVNFNRKILDKNYLIYYLQYPKTQNIILSKAGASTIPDLNHKDFYSINIIIPSLQEQKAIAEVLSDIDNLIENLDKLIQKKKLIKKGVMQNFLTGKKRLPGFKGEWVRKKLGAIGITYGGLTGKKKNDFGIGNSYYIPFLNVLMNIKVDTKNLEKVNIKINENQNKVKKGDLFFNTSSETPEEVGMCAVLTEELENTYLNSFCFGYRLKDKSIDGLFLSYLINSEIGRKIFANIAQGATRYNLSKKHFDKIEIFIPPTLEEQKAISQILSDMDTEIEALERKKEKYEKIKKGAMELLLTGKVRLRKDND